MKIFYAFVVLGLLLNTALNTNGKVIYCCVDGDCFNCDPEPTTQRTDCCFHGYCFNCDPKPQTTDDPRIWVPSLEPVDGHTTSYSTPEEPEGEQWTESETNVLEIWKTSHKIGNKKLTTRITPTEPDDVNLTSYATPKTLTLHLMVWIQVFWRFGKLLVK